MLSSNPTQEITEFVQDSLQKSVLRGKIDLAHGHYRIAEGTSTRRCLIRLYCNKTFQRGWI